MRDDTGAGIAFVWSRTSSRPRACFTC